MTEITEREILERIEGMTQEEKIVVATSLPDSILWDEIQKRYAKAKARTKLIESIVTIWNKKGEQMK